MIEMYVAIITLCSAVRFECDTAAAQKGFAQYEVCQRYANKEAAARVQEDPSMTIVKSKCYLVKMQTI
jgi:hypothetical protein